MPGRNDRPRKKPLPPELEFLVKLPDLKAMEPEAQIVFCRAHLTRMKQNRDAMLAHGLDAEGMITYYEAIVVDAENAQRSLEETQNALLHAAANVADSQYAAYKALEALVQDLQENAPFDPATQEAVEFLEEWRTQMPKE
jgi:hypothetical protein